MKSDLPSTDPDDPGAAASAPRKKAKRQEATIADYIGLIELHLGKLKRDIFSGNLMYFDNSERIWLPAANREDSLRAIARQESLETNINYAGAGIKENLALLEQEGPRSLIVDIPTWDGDDRLKFLCSKVRLNEDQLIGAVTFEEIVKTWCANLFRKLEDPSMNQSPAREFVLILSSKTQEIGKDYWIRSLLCGLGQWFSSFHVSNDTTDLYMQLHESMALYLGEFDRTNRVEAGLMKDLITSDHSKIRAKYDRKGAYRHSRASFIASCNGTDVFRDHTGNSRFALFEIDSIERNYSKSEDFSLQCMAQAKKLAADGYNASLSAWKELNRSRDELTPDDPHLTIIDIWNQQANKFLDQLRLTDSDDYSNIMATGIIPNTINAPIIKDVSAMAGVSPRVVRLSLASQRLLTRTKTARGVRFMPKGDTSRLSVTEDDGLF